MTRMTSELSEVSVLFCPRTENFLEAVSFFLETFKQNSLLFVIPRFELKPEDQTNQRIVDVTEVATLDV